MMQAKAQLGFLLLLALVLATFPAFEPVPASAAPASLAASLAAAVDEAERMVEDGDAT